MKNPPLRKRRRLIESSLLRNCYLVTLDKDRNFHVHPMDKAAPPRTIIRLPQFPKPVAFQTVIKVFDSSKLSVLGHRRTWTLDTAEWRWSSPISSLSPQWLATFTASSTTNEVLAEVWNFVNMAILYRVTCQVVLKVWLKSKSRLRFSIDSVH